MDAPRISGDTEVDVFVDANLLSFPSWDLMQFLHQHPDADSTLPQLCSAIARPETEVAPAVRRCVESGMVERSESPDGGIRYRLTTDGHTRSLLDRFHELAKVREIRLELVRHVMRRLTG
jgi:DNA-binding MarR family transcriptional regulator